MTRSIHPTLFDEEDGVTYRVTVSWGDETHSRAGVRQETREVTGRAALLAYEREVMDASRGHVGGVCIYSEKLAAG